jgi:hypothetical protein
MDKSLEGRKWRLLYVLIRGTKSDFIVIFPAGSLYTSPLHGRPGRKSLLNIRKSYKSDVRLLKRTIGLDVLAERFQCVLHVLTEE